jgi:hypothetical protein
LCGIGGSAIYENDVTSPIIHCEKLGYKEDNIIIDVVLSGNPHLLHIQADKINALSMMSRTLEVMNYYNTMLGLLRAKSGHPGVKFRYAIGPSVSIASKIIPVVSIYLRKLIRNDHLGV